MRIQRLYLEEICDCKWSIWDLCCGGHVSWWATDLELAQANNLFQPWDLPPFLCEGIFQIALHSRDPWRVLCPTAKLGGRRGKSFLLIILLAALLGLVIDEPRSPCFVGTYAIKRNSFSNPPGGTPPKCVEHINTAKQKPIMLNQAGVLLFLWSSSPPSAFLFLENSILYLEYCILYFWSGPCIASV